MNIYENIIILNASLADEEIETASGKIKDLIANSGGEILKVDTWGRKKLGYEIKKQKKGFFILLIFKAPSSTIKKLEDYYKVFDPVIKYMVLRLNRKQAEAATAGIESKQVPAVEAASGEKTEQKSEA